MHCDLLYPLCGLFVSLNFIFYSVPIYPFVYPTLNAYPVDSQSMVTNYQNHKPKTKLHL